MTTKISKQSVTVLIIAAVIAAVAGFKILGSRGAKQIDSVAARSTGGPNAKVHIVEFIDFQCPACAYGSKLLKEQREKYPQDIHLQVKYFPLIKTHTHAMQSALYSECAARQGRFWEFHELLMPAQPQWSPLINAEANFLAMAKQAGIDKARLDACLISDEAAKTINDERSLGQSLGVQSTPTYFINNKMVVGSKSLMDELNAYFPQTKQ